MSRLISQWGAGTVLAVGSRCWHWLILDSWTAWLSCGPARYTSVRYGENGWVHIAKELGTKNLRGETLDIEARPAAIPRLGPVRRALLTSKSTPQVKLSLR